MAVNQDLTIPEEVVLADMADQDEEEILEMTEVEEKDRMIKMVIEIATADVVDGNTVKLKDLNHVMIAEIQTENQDGFEKVIATIRKLSRVVSTMTLNVIAPE